MPRLPHPRTALSGYADSRLPRWRRAVVGHHVRRCTRCAVEVAQIRALGELLRRPPPVEDPPPELVERLLAIAGERPDPAEPAEPEPSRPAGVPAGSPDRPRAGVGAVGAMVASLLLLATVAVGSAVTGVAVPGTAWPSATARAAMSSVLPRLWSGETRPGGAASVRPVDNGARP